MTKRLNLESAEERLKRMDKSLSKERDIFGFKLKRLYKKLKKNKYFSGFLKKIEWIKKSITKFVKKNLAYGLVIILFISLLLYSYFSQINIKIQNSGLNFDSFLLAVSSIIATIFALFFSVSLIAIQHAASEYSPTILKKIKKDAKTISVMLFFLFTIYVSIFFFVKKDYSHILFILCLYSLSFLLLIFQFYRVINFVNPMYIIKLIREDALDHISKIPKIIDKRIKKIKPKTEYEDALLKSNFYKSFRFYHEKEIHFKTKTYLIQISDLIQNAARKKQYETVKEGFDSFYKIIDSYFILRKSHIAQEDELLQFSLERIQGIYKIAIKNDDYFLIIESLKVLKNVGISSTKLETISPRSFNQITALITYYISDIGKKIAKSKEMDDAVKYCILSLKEIGKNAIINHQNDSMATEKIQEQILEQQSWYIYHHVLSAYLELLIYSIYHKCGVYEIKELIKKIEYISLISLSEGKGNQTLTGPLFGIMSDKAINKVVTILINKLNENYEAIETRSREEYVKNVLDKLFQFFDDFALACIKFNENGLLQDHLEHLVKIVKILYNTQLKTYEGNFSSEVKKIIQITKKSFLKYPVSKLGHVLPIKTKIPEILFEAGIEIIKEPDLVEELVDSVISMAEDSLKKERDGYNALRIIDDLAFFSYYVYSKSDKNITKDIIKKISLFDKKYDEKKHNCSLYNHYNLITKRYETFSKWHAPLESFRTKIIKKVDNKNLKTFLEFVKKYQ